jgi:hypothetical protein
MVITIHIDRWDISRFLVDNGSEAKILFLSAFEKMGYDKNHPKEPTKPLYGFSGKRIKLVGVITLLISFGTPKNPRTKHIIFNVVDMLYPNNAIFGRGLLNTYEAALHSVYLCLKIPATFSVITIFNSQNEARNIEHGFAPEHKNVHFLREDAEHEQPSSRQEIPVEFKKAIKAEGDFIKVPLDPKIPDRIVCIGAEMSPKELAELLQFLDKNSDILAWSTSDLRGVSREVIEHKLQVNPNAKPKKQKLCKMSEEKIEVAKVEVQCLLDATFIREVRYLQWLAKVVVVRKKNGKWQMCIDFTDLNKCCPKDDFPLAKIDQIVDSAACYYIMAQLDYFSSYHQI